jgi:hypothetical protein
MPGSFELESFVAAARAAGARYEHRRRFSLAAPYTRGRVDAYRPLLLVSEQPLSMG